MKKVTEGNLFTIGRDQVNGKFPRRQLAPNYLAIDLFTKLDLYNCEIRVNSTLVGCKKSQQ